MITETKSNAKSKTVKKSRKDYFMVVVDHKPQGICTTVETALSCAGYYAEKYGAKETNSRGVYVYRDSDERHLIYVETIKRIKLPSDLDED